MKHLHADGNYTEYVDFAGQPIAEKDQTGAWTDYVFAGGKRIARVNAPLVLHHYGVCGNCSSGASNFYVSALWQGVKEYTIDPNDRLMFAQKQTNARAGLYLYATDGTNSMYNLTDQNKDWINSSSVPDGTGTSGR